MDIISAYRQAGTYRGAAAICGTTHKTVRRVIERAEADQPPVRKVRARNYQPVERLVADRMKASAGRVSAKRLLPVARTAGYEGSGRNFRRLVAAARADDKSTTPAAVGRRSGRRVSTWSSMGP